MEPPPSILPSRCHPHIPEQILTCYLIYLTYHASHSSSIIFLPALPNGHPIHHWPLLLPGSNNRAEEDAGCRRRSSTREPRPYNIGSVAPGVSLHLHLLPATSQQSFQPLTTATPQPTHNFAQLSVRLITPSVFDLTRSVRSLSDGCKPCSQYSSIAWYPSASRTHVWREALPF